MCSRHAGHVQLAKWGVGMWDSDVAAAQGLNLQPGSNTGLGHTGSHSQATGVVAGAKEYCWPGSGGRAPPTVCRGCAVLQNCLDFFFVSFVCWVRGPTVLTCHEHWVLAYDIHSVLVGLQGLHQLTLLHSQTVAAPRQSRFSPRSPSVCPLHTPHGSAMCVRPARARCSWQQDEQP